MKIPEHIAIIMDGNGRWASRLILPKKAGHKKGAQVAKQIVIDCKKLGVKYLTLYTFSSENWCRPKDEVADLMNLLREYLSSSAQELIKQDVRIRFIGRRSILDADIQELMYKVEEESKHHAFTLVLAINYGSHDELRDAAMEFANYKQQNPDATANDFEKFLYTKDIPNPDLLIRTGGELRISNFLLWQLAYTELYFTDTMWPEFSEKDLINAVEDFSSRERRYGGRNS
ncbi:MAG: undecaprenyl diphosphate synthase [Candidatus Midichloriaceae bacterium]|jgi:undecaprenyl diphosphate synthase|nr:undecaprenyl diphosphate synthase [Candidatus Midichloriaceae bacterium]